MVDPDDLNGNLWRDDHPTLEEQIENERKLQHLKYLLCLEKRREEMESGKINYEEFLGFLSSPPFFVKKDSEYLFGRIKEGYEKRGPLLFKQINTPTNIAPLSYLVLAERVIIEYRPFLCFRIEVVIPKYTVNTE